MNILILIIFFSLSFPLLVLAQDQQRTPEEMEIIGDRSLSQLRKQMEEAEKNAYAIFNEFNDEKRFNIHCRMHQPTGTRIERQVCQAEFEIEATRDHARDYFSNYRDLIDPHTPPNSSPMTHTPTAARIASQQEAYRRKLRQVAEEHPEFLNAVIEFTEMQARYDAATSMRNNGD